LSLKKAVYNTETKRLFSLDYLFSGALYDILKYEKCAATVASLSKSVIKNHQQIFGWEETNPSNIHEHLYQHLQKAVSVVP
jgi:hypothetical protein